LAGSALTGPSSPLVRSIHEFFDANPGRHPLGGDLPNRVGRGHVWREMEVAKERKSLRQDVWGFYVKHGIISLSGPSRGKRRGGIPDYRAAGVSFFTAWA
jgi:hypothetical protein